MKKKLFISLFLVLSLFMITGCGNKKTNDKKDKKETKENRESIKNQQGYKEGKYFIDNLTFNLPDGYELDGTNRYKYLDTNNALTVELYVDNKIDDLMTFIKKDTHSFYPTIDNLKETDIHGNKWLKGKTIDNTIVYYIKDGTKAYSVMLSPVFTTKGTLDTLISTFEEGLYFKN